MFEQPPVLVAPAVPAPPVVSVRPQDATTSLVTYRPSPIRCAGAQVPFARRIEPFVVAVTRYPGQTASHPATVTLRFRTGDDGRPLSIARATAVIGASQIYADTSDLEPSLAASRLAPGARSDCEISYAPDVQLLESASHASLIAAAASPTVRAHWPRVYARLAPAGSDCNFPRLRPRVLVNPDLRRFEGRPERQGAVIAFDVAADGRPANLRVVHAGDDALAREVQDAVSATRFFPTTPVRACVVGFFVGGRQADDEQLRLLPRQEPPSSDSCPVTPADPPPVRPGPYPENFQRRNVEGHAVLRYDVASWGAVGNIRVDASEPAAIFGERAASALRNRQFPATDMGKKDCMLRVIYRLEE